MLSRTAIKRICTKRLNSLNALARVGEQQLMTDIRSMIGNGLRTPYPMRKQEIAELMHDPACSNQAHPHHKKIYGEVLADLRR